MSGIQGPLATRAPAKINLYLHVLGRRPDGYHRLDSLVAFADIGDELQAGPAETLSLTLTGPFADALAGESDNLVLKAARLLGPGRGAHLTLVKNLPVASGIGGGSADAAAALRLLRTLWAVDLDPATLREQAFRLGADVPVCLAGQPAFLGGAGEDLAPAPRLPPAGLVLVNPGRPLSTPAVFAARQGPFSAAARFEAAPGDAAGLADLLRQRGNDLEAAAVGLVPEIGAVLAALGDTPGSLLARMSGSGATCFALYRDRAAAESAAERLRPVHPRWWIKAASLAVS